MRSLPFLRAVRALGSAAMLATIAACSDDTPTDLNTGANDGSILLATSIPDQSGQNGSSFFQTVSLDQPSVTNANAFEQTFFPYAFLRGNTVIVLQGVYGDRAVRYVRGADGRLTAGGQLDLAAGGFPAGLAFASDTKAYISLAYHGKIVVFNPQTMTKTGEIDLTTLGITRNPANPSDRNPEPGVMVIRDGKLYVCLAQALTGYADSANGMDVAVIDVATDRYEQVISDSRISSPGRYGFSGTFSLDEQGDLYVYGHASFGSNPAQTQGILRIRRGATTFDPGFIVNISSAANLPAGKIAMIHGAFYHNGYLYATAEIPTLYSNPPNWAADQAYVPMRIRLSTGALEPLPLPRTTAYGFGITAVGGRIVFGLAAAPGLGLYTYDLATGAGSPAPVVRTVGAPSIVLAF
jgi:hypothetical protein